ncbi:MAG: hypothetical protein H7A45_15690 [Verrucomicrobiales bacterium]|nr:hypothetical protein [Verrucomicrobiales bacterium]
MSVHLSNVVSQGLPPEPELLQGVQVRLIKESERPRFDDLLRRRHYLKNATAVGQALRYVAEFQGQWLALLVFCSPAFHLKPWGPLAALVGPRGGGLGAICWPKTSASWSWPPPGALAQSGLARVEAQL